MSKLMISLILIAFLSNSCRDINRAFSFSNEENKCGDNKVEALHETNVGFLNIEIGIPESWEEFERKRDTLQDISSVVWAPKDIKSFEGYKGVIVTSWLDSNSLDGFVTKDSLTIIKDYNAIMIESGDYYNGHVNFLWLYFIGRDKTRGDIHNLMFYTKHKGSQFIGVLLSRSGVDDLHSEICSVKHIIETVRFTE